MQVRAKLTVNGAPNVMPFRWFKESPHAAYLVRQYFHANLLERLSSPPFLSLIEKKWLAFQLLQAVQQCHAAGVCHGDIKAENVPRASALTCRAPPPSAAARICATPPHLTRTRTRTPQALLTRTAPAPHPHRTRTYPLPPARTRCCSLR